MSWLLARRNRRFIATDQSKDGSHERDHIRIQETEKRRWFVASMPTMYETDKKFRDKKNKLFDRLRLLRGGNMTDKEIKNIYDILTDITLVLEKHVKEKTFKSKRETLNDIDTIKSRIVDCFENINKRSEE